MPIEPEVDELRDRLEQALLRRASRMLDDMADSSGDELTEVMRELDERIALAENVGAVVETTDDELREQLAQREAEVAARAAALAASEAALVEREAEIGRLRASIATLRSELDEARAEAHENARLRTIEATAAHEHERRARELQQRLAEATLRRTSADGVFEGQRARYAEREARAAELEAAASERLQEVDELERTAARREAQLDLREDDIERGEADLKAWEQRLTRREAELAVYVGQVQDALLERR